MDVVKIGLDFGTHQTKICVQRIPDEGHGEPNYEFFQFKDLEGEKSYFLPSVIQINDDDTLSYGYVDETRKKAESEAPNKTEVELEKTFNVADMAMELFLKYATENNSDDDVHALEKMLQIRLQNINNRNQKLLKDSDMEYESLMREYRSARHLFRYFKQATFIGGTWSKATLISNRVLCIWYLAYIIFLLEKEFGQDFSINMGIPTDEVSYKSKKCLAVEIIASAYYLVEDVYKNDMSSFLKEKFDVLLEKTEKKIYSEEMKKLYNISIFPEAYASLLSLTSRRKLPEGMSITADIGGGTTDISFFMIEDGIPMIYKFWSIPKGLNYIAEESGFDYADGSFERRVKQYTLDKYNEEKQELIYYLVQDLCKKIKNETSIPVQRLRDALKDRILVYSGGGSTYKFLTQSIDTFTDVRIIDASVWNEENVKAKKDVSKLSALLTTAYGLSLSRDDSSLKLKNYTVLFNHLPRKHANVIEEISKDQC